MIYDLSRVFLGVTYSFPCAWSLTSVNTRSIFADLVDVGFVSTLYPVRYIWDYAIIFGYLLSLMIYQFYISLVICEYWLLYLFLICSASKTSDHAFFLNLAIWYFLSNPMSSFFWSGYIMCLIALGNRNYKPQASAKMILVSNSSL